MKDFNLENRRYVIGGVGIAIVLIYTLRLFTLQLLSDDYKKNADSNAFLKKIKHRKIVLIVITVFIIVVCYFKYNIIN